jgi:twitching motility protein PilT
MSETLADLPFIDLYIRLDESDRPLFRSKELAKGHLNQLVPESFLPAINAVTDSLRAALEKESETTFDLSGLRLRLSRQVMADGSVWACTRRIDTVVPNLQKLGFAPHIYNHLHQLGLRDGLVIISGSAGQGKTTTAAGLLTDYLTSYGGLAITVEDPVEYVMRGRHGEFGQCFQLEPKNDVDWEAYLKRAMRWAPRYIFVGEVRTPKATEQLIRAATTGHMVITTVNASAPEDALTGLLFLAEQAMGSGSVELVAGCLTALLHQTMKESGPFVRYLFTEENAPGDPIRSLIRENKIGMMSTYIDRIAARLANQPVGLAGGASLTPASGGLPPLPRTPPKH